MCDAFPTPVRKALMGELEGGGTAAGVKIHIAGRDVYLCARWLDESTRWRKPGCLIYAGTPDEEKQKRIRSALSFSLGMFLVSLGHTIYSTDWQMVSFKSVSPCSIDGRVFDLPVMPPAPYMNRHVPICMNSVQKILL